MLKIKIVAEEEWSDEKQEFLPPIKPIELTLEHSLISLSKWESKWKKPFFTGGLTREQESDYYRCMCLTQNVPEEIFDRIPDETRKEITKYIIDPMTATWFSGDESKSPLKRGRMNGEIVTSEVVYGWMIGYGIPIECQKWHLSRLLTLIRVMNAQNSTPKKMSKSEIAKRYSQLNAKRRAKLGTKG